MKFVFYLIGGLVSFLVIVFTPKALAAEKYPYLVILDAGHGGSDTGTVQYRNRKIFFEKNFSLSVAKKAATFLRQKGIPSVLTRTKDSDLGLDSRIAIANSWGQKAKRSLFISIHANSSNLKDAFGVETYVFNATTNDASKRLANLENGSKIPVHGVLDLILSDLTTTANYSDSVKLACMVQDEVSSGLLKHGYKTKNRGVKQALLYVLMRTRMPAILIEPGFASNASDFKRLSQDSYQNILAKELASAAIKWRDNFSPSLLASSDGELAHEQISAILKNKRRAKGLCANLY